MAKKKAVVSKTNSASNETKELITEIKILIKEMGIDYWKLRDYDVPSNKNDTNLKCFALRRLRNQMKLQLSHYS